MAAPYFASSYSLMFTVHVHSKNNLPLTENGYAAWHELVGAPDPFRWLR